MAPADLQDLRGIITEYRDIPTRASGSDHTFNDISLTDGLTLRTTNLTKVLNLTQDSITVEAGTRIRDINDYLAMYNLSLPLQAAISAQSTGGVISTGTHGSDITRGSFCNAVLDLTLVHADGSVRTYTEADPEFSALRCSLGCLGAIYSITFQCEPLYSIEEVKMDTTWKEFAAQLPSILEEYPLTQASVDPFSPSLETQVVLRRKVPWQNGMVPGYAMLTNPFPNTYYLECEMALPLEVIGDAVIYTANLHRSLYGEEYKVNLGIRFCSPDSTLISQESGRNTAFISSFFDDRIDPRVGTDLLKQVCNALIRQYQGRPHYGKIHDLTSEKMEYLYGVNYELFRQIKHDLDPTGHFDNPYIQCLFE